MAKQPPKSEGGERKVYKSRFCGKGMNNSSLTHTRQRKKGGLPDPK